MVTKQTSSPHARLKDLKIYYACSCEIFTLSNNTTCMTGELGRHRINKPW